MRSSGLRGAMWRKELVQEPVASRFFRSPHESTPNTMAAYSQEAVHHHSLTKIASMFGSTLCTVSWCHFVLPSREFELPKCMALVGVGMCVEPVKFLFPTRNGRSP